MKEARNHPNEKNVRALILIEAVDSDGVCLVKVVKGGRR